MPTSLPIIYLGRAAISIPDCMQSSLFDPPSLFPSPPPLPRQAVLPAALPAEWQALGAQLPNHLCLGTSSWSFPGWQGLVYGGEYSESKLSRHGLQAYSQHPILRAAGIDRSFYAPVPQADYAAYAKQVPSHFRFLVKAPSLVSDAMIRTPNGQGMQANPCFLDAQLASQEYVLPATQGLGRHCGPLVFQLSPLPAAWLQQPATLIQRLQAFFQALPPLNTQTTPAACYALELRDAALLTPRLIKMLRDCGVRYCLGLHARMPEIARQAAALALLDPHLPGPLVVRWNLHAGFRYEQAKAKYAPFNRLIDADPRTRSALATLAVNAIRAEQPVTIIINNKAEGSSPLSCFHLAHTIMDQLR